MRLRGLGSCPGSHRVRIQTPASPIHCSAHQNGGVSLHLGPASEARGPPLRVPLPETGGLAVFLNVWLFVTH